MPLLVRVVPAFVDRMELRSRCVWLALRSRVGADGLLRHPLPS
jgi:hypothetical protein